MPQPLSITMVQANPLVGDVRGNGAQILAHHKQARTDLLVFSELFLSGYPPEDIVLHKSFQDEIAAAIDDVAAAVDAGGPAVLVGTPYMQKEKLYNAAILLSKGARQIYCKSHLPNNNVFDEKRIFAPGRANKPLRLNGRALGVCICEDMWTPTICKRLTQQGADILLVLNGSPFELTKQAQRLQLARKRAQANKRALLYINQVGGQDELVFDGASFALHHNGDVACQLPAWENAQTTLELDADISPSVIGQGVQHDLPQAEASIYAALQLGVRDYARKNGFKTAVLGLSGGIDSALVACIAVDALGRDNVQAIMMPSPYTSDASTADARLLADTLGIQLGEIPITDAMAAVHAGLRKMAHKVEGVTAENLQSRLRGVFVMAHSNATGALLLSTGNKSEMAVGYATLYGDMNGGFNPLKDVYKKQVMALAHWRNQHQPAQAKGPKGVCIPPRILDKPPSAELRPEQKDSDSLPDYDVLDGILYGLIEEEKSLRALAQDYDSKLVRHVAQLVMQAEYKRRQAPPGVKIHTREFGRGRRYPITSKFVYGTQTPLARESNK